MDTTSQRDAREVYTNGYGEAALHFMKRRTLATHGRFIEPLLRLGQRILDLGCGPGTMTRDLARCVGPNGSVVGIDREGAQFEGRKDLSVTFRAMDAYRLEFEKETFDGIFSHALFEHLARPMDVLTEARRVLKTGGFIGLRSPDWGGFIAHPCNEPVRAALMARLELQTCNGGNVHAGRHLGEWLRRAGFADVKISANYEIYDDNAFIVEHIASQLENDGQVQHAQAWRKWGENPEAMFAQAWFEAIGYKGDL